ncbi:hypothetical protein [Acinetobacter baumannii]|uniref:hypothetical protein n=1 Tax=Acinetobacter baumannii TaxID=470 RepID=UPI000288D5D3|nr:hypothetical protein [Acinetobacter baumannii]
MTDLNKERELFLKFHYEQYLRENPEVKKENAKYIYDYAHKNMLVDQLRESHFVVWLAAKAQAVPEKKIYLTCEQLYAAANFGAPNKDPELLETELTIAWFDEAHSGSGYYVYISEYPEEGAMKLESESGAEG